MNRKILFFAVFVLGSGFLAATWYLTRQEDSKMETVIDPNNHLWLAAELFLKKLDYQVDGHRDFPNFLSLSPERGTILFTESQYALSSDQAQKLVDWVVRGGHLILVGAEPSDVVDDPIGLLMAKFGLETFTAGQPITYAIDLDGQPSCEVGFINNIRFKSSADGKGVLFKQGDAFGNLMMVLSHEAGKITLLVDANFWTNINIGEKDHAAFLERVIHFSREEIGPIWIVSGSNFPNLIKLLSQKAWMVLLTFGLLLTLLLWRLIPRLGPLLPEPLPERRRLMEHIEASGQFLWDHYRGEKLLAAVHTALMRRIRSRHPTWMSLDQAELAIRLGEVSGLSREEAAESLEGGTVRDPDRFWRLVKNLVSMRSIL